SAEVWLLSLRLLSLRLLSLSKYRSVEAQHRIQFLISIVHFCLDTKTNQKGQDSIKKPTLQIFTLNKIILATLKQAFCSLRVKTFIVLRLFYNVVFRFS